MQGVGVNVRSRSGVVRRALGLLGLALLLAACGGGGDGAAEPAPPVAPGPGVGSGPGPAIESFRLMPERLALAVGGSGALLALQAPGATAWSSSDPAVASVDAQGQVSALATGSAVISASAGGLATSSTVKVFASAAATPSTLIAAALAQNRISVEQALTYRVFALFGDVRLPPEFDGAPDGEPDHMLMRQVSVALPTLSQAARDVLLPFVLPPIYAQSWYAVRLGAPAAAAAPHARAHTNAAHRS